MKKIFLWTCALGLSLVVGSQTVAAESKGYQTITGIEYVDTNKNATYNLGEKVLRKHTVSLYETIEEAISGENPVRTTQTNGIGSYSFTRLARKKHYIRYGSEEGINPTGGSNAVLDENGNTLPNILEVDTSKRLITKANLGTSKPNPLNFHIFNDSNFDGLMNNTEKIQNGETIIMVNLAKMLTVLNEGGFGEIDEAKLTSDAMKGSISLGEGAIIFQTTKSFKAIEITDPDSGMYVYLRSPFNLSFTGLLADQDKITALVNLVTTGDVSEIFENPDLLATSNMTSNEDFQYIKNAGNFFSTIYDKVDNLNLGNYVGNNAYSNLTNFISQQRSILQLINNIPILGLITVDYWGNAYELEYFKIVKTTNFYIGVKNHAQFSGFIYDDLNNNGIKDAGEKGFRGMNVSAVDNQGNVLDSITTNSTGRYSLKNLPYDTPFYILFDGVRSTQPTYLGDAPFDHTGSTIVLTDTFYLNDGVTSKSMNIFVQN